MNRPASRLHRVLDLIHKARGPVRPWDGIVMDWAANQLPVTSGCYGLIKGSRIVYVGQAVNVRHRVGQHLRRAGGFPCDKVAWCAVEKDVLNHVESGLIAHWNPPFNTQRPCFPSSPSIMPQLHAEVARPTTASGFAPQSQSN